MNVLEEAKAEESRARTMDIDDFKEYVKLFLTYFLLFKYCTFLELTQVKEFNKKKLTKVEFRRTSSKLLEKYQICRIRKKILNFVVIFSKIISLINFSYKL